MPSTSLAMRASARGKHIEVGYSMVLVVPQYSHVRDNIKHENRVEQMPNSEILRQKQYNSNAKCVQCLRRGDNNAYYLYNNYAF